MAVTARLRAANAGCQNQGKLSLLGITAIKKQAVLKQTNLMRKIEEALDSEIMSKIVRSVF